MGKGVCCGRENKGGGRDFEHKKTVDIKVKNKRGQKEFVIFTAVMKVGVVNKNIGVKGEKNIREGWWGKGRKGG